MQTVECEIVLQGMYWPEVSWHPYVNNVLIGRSRHATWEKDSFYIAMGLIFSHVAVDISRLLHGIMSLDSILDRSLESTCSWFVLVCLRSVS